MYSVFLMLSQHAKRCQEQNICISQVCSKCIKMRAACAINCTATSQQRASNREGANVEHECSTAVMLRLLRIIEPS